MKGKKKQQFVKMDKKSGSSSKSKSKSKQKKLKPNKESSTQLDIDLWEVSFILILTFN